MSGFTQSFAVKYSYILSVPAIIGALAVELGQFSAPAMTVGLGFTFVLGMLISAVVGYFTIRVLLRLVNRADSVILHITVLLWALLLLIGNYVL